MQQRPAWTETIQPKHIENNLLDFIIPKHMADWLSFCRFKATSHPLKDYDDLWDFINFIIVKNGNVTISDEKEEAKMFFEKRQPIPLFLLNHDIHVITSDFDVQLECDVWNSIPDIKSDFIKSLTKTTTDFFSTTTTYSSIILFGPLLPNIKPHDIITHQTFDAGTANTFPIALSATDKQKERKYNPAYLIISYGQLFKAFQ